MTWRTRTDESGVVWRERPKPGTASTIERERISPIAWDEDGIIRGTYEAPRLIEGRARSATSSGTPLPALEREVPELRQNATPKVTVTIGRIAREAIRDELRRDDRLIEIGHLETGGCLVAEIKLGGRSARILDATWPGGPGRGYDQVRISEALGQEVAANYREWSQSDARMVGCWHSHPIRVTTPSEPDRANALAFLDRANTERWLPFTIDMIVSPSRNGEWWHPEIHAWVTRRSSAGTPYTEPATVEGRI